MALLRYFLLLHMVIPQGFADRLILGHNLTPTTDVLKNGDATVGSYAVAYGLSDQLTLSTSTWLDLSYSMPNFGLRYSVPLGFAEMNWGVEGMYFRTFDYGDRLFKQTSFFVRSTYGGTVLSFLKSYLSVGYQYFWNDKRAYSIRAVPQKKDPTTLSISTLQVFKVHEGLSLLLEAGQLGMNYRVPFWHYGASVNVGNATWFLQFGFTVSKSQKAIDYEIDKEGRMYWSGTSQDIDQHGVVAIVHPEIQVQFTL